MKTRAVLVVLLLPAACFADVDDNRLPAHTDLQRLEERLSRHPCVAHLEQWERNYRFSRKMGLLTPYSLNPDFDVIEFHLRRVGTVTISPGRKVMAPGGRSGDWPDSSPIKSIDGTFTLGSGSLKIERCKPVGTG